MQKGDYTQLATNKEVFPVPERPAAIGPTGGFGWLLELALGAPKSLRIMNTEILPDSPLALGIAYPQSTSFTQLRSLFCKAVYAGASQKKSFHVLKSSQLLIRLQQFETAWGTATMWIAGIYFGYV